MTERALTDVSAFGTRGTLLRRASAILLLAVGCGLAFWVGTGFGNKPESNGGLQIAESSLDFGDPWESSRFPLSVQIRNPTGRDLNIEKFTTSCSCVGFPPPSLVIKAGEAAEVRLTLNLMAAQSGEGDLAYFTARLIPHLEGLPGPEEGWEIKGRVRKGWVRAEPAVVDFGDEIIKGDGPATKTVLLLPNRAVRKLTAIAEPSQLETSIEAPTAEKPEYRLKVTPVPTLAPGFFSSPIKIRATFADGTEAEITPVTASGVAHLSVEGVPDPLLLGMIPLGKSVASVVSVRSLRKRHVQIERVEIPTDSVRAEPIETAESSDEHRYRVILLANKEGAQSVTIHFWAKEKGTQTLLPVPIIVSYFGRRQLDVANLTAKDKE